MKRIFFGTIGAILLAACSSTTNNSNNAPETTAVAADTTLSGRWNIETIHVSDSLHLHPAGVAVIFGADSTFTFITGCNNIGGGYLATADSIQFLNPWRTEMACEDMTTEDAIAAVLQSIHTYTIENDSTLILGSDSCFIEASK